jgi:transposase-like protein
MAKHEINSNLGGMQNLLLSDKDFLKRIIRENMQEIIHREFNEYMSVAPYERNDKRHGYRNGSYQRSLVTRVGKIELAVCRDREGQFRTELFARYQRSEQSLLLAMVEMYLKGVSTRKVRKIVDSLCGIEISRSQVSAIAKTLDEHITAWRQRSLSDNYPYLIIDARYEKIRTEQGVHSQAVMIVVGVTDQGMREILSVEIGDSENDQEWGRVLGALKARGLKNVFYLVSDDHKGLVKALGKHFQGAIWQRCQVHFIRNFISRMGKMKAAVFLPQLKDIFAATSEKDARERKDRLAAQLEPVKESVSQWLDEQIEDCFNVFKLPESHWRRMRSTNMLERYNQELKRRSRVVRIFPNKQSCLRLIASMSMEQSEEWQSGNKYLEMEDLKKMDRYGRDKMGASGVTSIPLRSIPVTPLEC